jgi:hypothetical protein
MEVAVFAKQFGIVANRHSGYQAAGELARRLAVTTTETFGDQSQIA